METATYTYLDRNGEAHAERYQEQIAAYEANMRQTLVTKAQAARANSFGCGYRAPVDEQTIHTFAATLLKHTRFEARALNPVLAAIGAVRAGMTPQTVAYKAYEAVLAVTQESYFDVIRAASPEPGRRSDQLHEYTTRDYVVLAVALGKAIGTVSPDHIGIGYALEAVARRYRIETGG